MKDLVYTGRPWCDSCKTQVHLAGFSQLVCLQMCVCVCACLRWYFPLCFIVLRTTFKLNAHTHTNYIPVGGGSESVLGSGTQTHCITVGLTLCRVCVCGCVSPSGNMILYVLTSQVAVVSSRRRGSLEVKKCVIL